MTARLVLIAMTPEAVLSEKAGDGRLGEILDCQIPAQWPPEHWEPHVLDWLMAHYQRAPLQFGWHRYVALRRENEPRVLIGTVGAFSLEETPEQAEFGYGLLPTYQGQGYATEAAHAVIELVRQTPGMTSVIAHTFPALRASLRVMEKCGLTYDGEGLEPGTVRYRIRF